MKQLHKLVAIAFCALAMLGCSEEVIEQKIVVEQEIVDPDLETYEINKAALRRMNTGQPITVTGHKSQDPDAVCSAIAMAALLRQLGMDATPYMQDKPIQAVKYILDYTGYPAPEVKTSIEPGMPLVMTDHNDYLQALDGARDANIVGIVDHHGVSSSFSSTTPIFCKFMNVGAANTIVYTIYRECGITPTREIARLMVAGIIADTDSLSKATCTAADSLALSQLCPIAQFGNLGELARGIDAAQGSFIGLTDEEIFLSDVKSYEIGGVKLAVTSLDANEMMHIDELCERMRAVMPAMQQKLGVQMVFAKMEEKFQHPDIPDATGAPTATYITHIPYYGEGAREVAEAAFGETKHDNCIVLDRKVSRKTDFIPAITKVLERE